MFPFLFGTMRLVVTAISLSLFLSAVSCTKKEATVNYSELTPILKQNNLNISNDRYQRGVSEIEEADSKLYGPLAGTTIYLESASPTVDSKDVRPRYWLRVEDFASVEMATKRASEYDAFYERLRKTYPSADKISVRMWAIARGRRVYALTTDSSFLTYITLPTTLRKSISMLPET